MSPESCGKTRRHRHHQIACGDAGQLLRELTGVSRPGLIRGLFRALVATRILRRMHILGSAGARSTAERRPMPAHDDPNQLWPSRNYRDEAPKLDGGAGEECSVDEGTKDEAPVLLNADEAAAWCRISVGR